MDLKVGQRLKSAVSSVEVIVFQAPSKPTVLTCGGIPMVDLAERGDKSETILAGNKGEVLLGKRYLDEATTAEVLCTKPGKGVLALGGHQLELKLAKKLPASD